MQGEGAATEGMWQLTGTDESGGKGADDQRFPPARDSKKMD